MKRDGSDDHFRQRTERAPKSCRHLIVQNAVPPMPDHDLGKNHGHRQAGALLMGQLNVVNQRGHERAVRRDNHFEWQMVAPQLPARSGSVLPLSQSG